MTGYTKLKQEGLNDPKLLIQIFSHVGNFVYSLSTSVFANSLDPDQVRKNIGPDLDPNCFTLMLFLNFFRKS